MIEIDGARALALLAEAVEAKGADYVYPRADYGGCTYARDDAPSCLVGHALHRAGLSIAALYGMDNDGIEDEEGNSLYSNPEIGNIPIERYGFWLTDEALSAFGTAQAKQDGGTPWGAALEAAKKAVGV